MKQDKVYHRKRRVASVLAIILVLAMILSLAAPFFSTAFSVQAYAASKNGIGDSDKIVNNKDITLQTQIGFDQTLMIGKASPFQLIFSNTGPNFKGEVQVEIYSYDSEEGGGEYTIYYQPLELATGATKQINMNLFVNTIHTPIKIGLVNESGEIILSKMIPVNFRDPNTVAIGVLSDNENNLSYLNALKMGYFSDENEKASGVDYNMTVFMDQKTFPDSVEVLDNFRMIIIDDFDTASLTANQLESLNRWVEAGGVLTLGTGENADKVCKGLSSLFSYELGKNTQIHSLSSMTEAVGEEISVLTPIELATIMIEGANPVFEENAVPLTLSLEKGSGIVFVHAFDLALSPITQIPNITKVLSTIYETKAKDHFMVLDENNNRKGYYNSSSDLSNQVINIPPMKTAVMRVIFILLFIYILILGPVLYIVLKKRDKREQGWLMIPAIAVLTTGIIFILSSQSPYKNNILSTISVVYLEDGSNLKETDVYACAKSPKSGEISFSSEEALSLNLSDQYNYYQAENQKRMTRKILCADETQISLFDNEKWNSNVFSYRSQTEIQGELASNFMIKKNKIVGEITNNTGYSLEDIVVMIGNQVVKLDDLGDGETQTVDFILDSFEEQNNSSYYQNYYNGMDQVFGNIEQRFDQKQITIERANELQKRVGILRNLTDVYSTKEMKVPVSIYAFLNEKVTKEKLLINHKNPLEINQSVFVKETSIHYQDMDEFELPFGFLTPSEWKTSDGQNVGIYDYSIYLDFGEDMECSFSIPEGTKIKNFQVRWPNYYQTSVRLEIYNRSSDVWEELKETEYSNAEDYIDEEGYIKVKSINQENGDINFPEIRIKGAGTNA